MNKKIFAGLFILSFTIIALIITPRSYAIGAEIRKEIKQDIKEERMENDGTRPGILKAIVNKSERAVILDGTISGKSGTTLTVTKDSNTYTVNIDSKTQLRRKFWGKATLDEIQIGDIVNVHGKWVDSGKTTIQAVLIRDESIQKRFGVFFGTITSISGSGFVMDTITRGSQTVTVSSTTKLVNRKGEVITQSYIILGHKVRVKGLWDNKANTITEVMQVKDFNLPAKPTPSK